MGEPNRLVLIKHAMPVLDPLRPAREWRLGDEGRSQASALAVHLGRFHPVSLIASPEAKAAETAEIAAEQLGVQYRLVDGLQEFDRPVLPILTRAEHERLNEAIFSKVDQLVLGSESARMALDRFSRALHNELARTREASLVVIAHGTVISLFVSAHSGIPAFDLWRRLSCPSMVVLERPSLAVVEIVESFGMNAPR